MIRPYVASAFRRTIPVVVFLLALEIGLRIYNPFPFRVRGDRIVLPVHQRYTIAHTGAARLDPVTHVTKNSLGFRGPEPPRDWSRRVTLLTIGGSTTECLFLSVVSRRCDPTSGSTTPASKAIPRLAISCCFVSLSARCDRRSPSS